MFYFNAESTVKWTEACPWPWRTLSPFTRFVSHFQDRLWLSPPVCKYLSQIHATRGQWKWWEHCEGLVMTDCWLRGSVGTGQQWRKGDSVARFTSCANRPAWNTKSTALASHVWNGTCTGHCEGSSLQHYGAEVPTQSSGRLIVGEVLALRHCTVLGTYETPAHAASPESGQMASLRCLQFHS